MRDGSPPARAEDDEIASRSTSPACPQEAVHAVTASSMTLSETRVPIRQVVFA